jgi:flavin-dependent dehydrogenase
MYDVIVVGAGPAGATTAKRCSEAGLTTILLERQKLPRKKVCDGTMAPRAQTLLKEEFGEIPKDILSKPASIEGLVFYVPDPVRYSYSTPWIRRSNLDYWMCQEAINKGVELWEAAQFVSLEEADQGYTVRIRRDRKEEKIESKFVVGADGGASRVRSCIFPGQRLNFLYQAHERFEKGPDLDRSWYHEFVRFTESEWHEGFSAYHKDDLFVIGYGVGQKGKLNSLMRKAHDLLAERFGFDATQKPVWAANCIEPWFGNELASHRFVPAKKNVLLVGDAGGYMPAISMEGIGPGIRTGQIAAQSILEAHQTGKQAEQAYLRNIERMNVLMGKAYEYENKIEKAREAGDTETTFRLTRAAEQEDFFTDY